MGRTKRYHYDPTTCSYEEVESTWIDWGKYGGTIVGLAILLAGGCLWMLDIYSIATPEERSLRAENQALERQLARASDHMARLSGQLDTLAERDRTLYRRLFQIDPLSEDVRQVGAGGSPPYKRFRRMSEPASLLLRKTAKKIAKLGRRMRLRTASYRKLTKLAKHRSTRLEQLPAIRPASGPIVSGYGMRHHPVLERPKKHEGVDFLLRPGTPVVATGNGTVERASYSSSYGHFVDIRHPVSEHRTLYAHLSDIDENIRPGREVVRGDTLGYSGNTGRTSGPHLHYEVQTLRGKALDPLQFFVPDMTPEAYRALEDRVQGYKAQLAETNPSEVSEVDESAR